MVFGLIACTNQKLDDSKDVAEEHNDAKFTNDSIERDAQFLVNAADFDLEQISIGKLAHQDGLTVDVRELGKMMEVAHKSSFDNLKELAQNKLITIPSAETSNTQHAYEKLRELSQNEFDKEYCDKVVRSHKDAITMFETASKASADNDIKEWATGMLSILKIHLDHALLCQRKFENN